jgi:uncharacterized protein (DUF1501 family)
MKKRKLSRRDIIKGSAALGLSVFATPLKAAARSRWRSHLT